MVSKGCQCFVFAMLYECAISAYGRQTVSSLGNYFIIILKQNALEDLFKLDFNFVFIANIFRFIFVLFDFFLVLIEIFRVSCLMKILNCIKLASSSHREKDKTYWKNRKREKEKERESERKMKKETERGREKERGRRREIVSIQFIKSYIPSNDSA